MSISEFGYVSQMKYGFSTFEYVFNMIAKYFVFMFPGNGIHCSEFLKKLNILSKS